MSDFLYNPINISINYDSGLTPQSSVFGFAEFISALALLVIVYTISDIRYKFRIHIAPLPLFTITYISIAGIGIGTLLLDVWSASQWPVLHIDFLSYFILQGFLGFLFLVLALAWIHYAFVRPRVFNNYNARKYAREILTMVLKSSEVELPIIANELARSAKNIVAISRESPSRIPSKGKKKKNENETHSASDHAYDILLMMGNRRLCKHIISSSPTTVMEFFKEFSKNLDKSLPVSQFVRNISTEAILNKDSILYHEDEGYNSFSKTIYGDYDLINVLFTNASPLNIHFKTALGLDTEQFEVYTRVTLITLEAYIEHNPNGTERCFALDEAYEYIGQAARNIYKIDGKTDYYSGEVFSKFSLAVDFVSDALRILNEKSMPDRRLKAIEDHNMKDIYDQLAKLIFDIILSASSVKSPRDTAWDVHYCTLWGELFNFTEQGAAQRVIYFRLRRMIYNEICQLSDRPNYKSAKILGICLNILGPTINQQTFMRHDTVLHKVIISWLKKNYLILRECQPDVADACIIGSITYDEENRRIVKSFKSYKKGNNFELPTEYLQLDNEKE